MKLTVNAWKCVICEQIFRPTGEAKPARVPASRDSICVDCYEKYRGEIEASSCHYPILAFVQSWLSRNEHIKPPLPNLGNNQKSPLKSELNGLTGSHNETPSKSSKMRHSSLELSEGTRK